MAREVMFSVCYADQSPPKVIQDLHTFTPAVLHDYCRHRVQFADYPAIVKEKGKSVRGIYVTGLTEANMVKLDFFEGSEYVRVQAKVKLLEKDADGKEREAEGEGQDVIVYEFISPENLEHGEWDFEHFRKERMNMWTVGDWADGQGESRMKRTCIILHFACMMHSRRMCASSAVHLLTRDAFLQIRAIQLPSHTGYKSLCVVRFSSSSLFLYFKRRPGRSWWMLGARGGSACAGVGRAVTVASTFCDQENSGENRTDMAVRSNMLLVEGFNVASVPARVYFPKRVVGCEN